MKGILIGATLATIIGVSLILTSLFNGNDGNIKKKKIYFNSDGNSDDFVALLLLLNMPNIEIVGLAITPSDCHVTPAKEFLSKICYKKGLNIPIVVSDVEPVNDFPASFKELTLKATYLPMLLNTEYFSGNELSTDASEHMYTTAKKIFEESGEKLTFLLTGPPSTLYKAMKNHSDMKNYIEVVYWMGGAIDVKGNVGESPYSEFNAYWDPPSTKGFIESGVPIKVISLDSTNSVPLDKDFLSRITKDSKKYNAANLAVELFAIAYFMTDDGSDSYYAWDCLAAMSLGFDDLMEYKEAEVDVITEKNENDNQEGRIYKKKGSNNFIQYAQPLDSEALEDFYDTFLDLLKYNF